MQHMHELVPRKGDNYEGDVGWFCLVSGYPAIWSEEKTKKEIER